MGNLVESMKKAAVDAVEASKPVAILFGSVISANPLKISVEQKMTLEQEELILTQNVADHSADVSVSWETAPMDEHNHGISGKKKMTMDSSLQVGESVLLLRISGGQKFVILDRVMS